MSLTIAAREFLKKKTNKSVWQELKESKDSNLIVVVIEDSAALIGLSIAFTGVLLVQITHLAIFDALASILIGIILGLVALFLANEMRKLLIGEGASSRNLKLIRDVVKGFPEVKHLGEVLTMHMGPDNILLAMNIDFQDKIPSSELEKVIDSVEQKIKKYVPEVKQIFIEADGVRITKSRAVKRRNNEEQRNGGVIEEREG